MKLARRIWARLKQQRAQSMVEYSIVIFAVALATLFTGYTQLANIVVSAVNAVVGLF
jgi:hypothetical protein